MADGEESSNNCRNNPTSCTLGPDSIPDDNPAPLHHLDLGDEVAHSSDTYRLGSQMAGPSSAEPPRDNPFSFKHFLDAGCRGARPKAYYHMSSISDLELPRMGVNTDASVLPDFVQDHLVVEQCYLGNPTSSSNFSLDLPDFTPSRDSVKVNRVNLESSHCMNRHRSSDSNDMSIPLDLPDNVRLQNDFPLDLPINNVVNNTNRNCSTNDVGTSKSLPDFLADGAVVHNHDNQELIEICNTNSDLESELRQELDITRRQLIEQQCRYETLQRELELARNKEHDYTQNLVKALEQVEENLERSNNSRVLAENTISKLKQEIRKLMTDVNHLKLENKQLRGEEGAAGCSNTTHPDYYSNELHSQRLAQELKQAASTAEHSLRQLLTGVDNLRIMAATLENMHRIEERYDNKFLDLDDDDSSGPAL